MLYSRFRPVTGDYEYFESPEQIALADDLPTPRLGMGTSIGVASVDAGRPIPSGAVYRGTGPDAKGVIAPISRSPSLGLLNIIEYIPGWGWLGIGVTTGWFLWKRKKG